MEDTVHDMAVLEDNNDPGGKTHDEGGGKDVLGPGKKFFGDPVGPETGDDSAHDPHSQEKRRDLRQIPFPDGYPDDQGDDGQEQDDENPALAGRERCILQPDGFRGGFPGLMGINNHEKRGKRREDGPAEHAVSHP